MIDWLRQVHNRRQGRTRTHQEGAPVKTPTSTILVAAVSFTSICSRGMLAGGEHIPAPWCFIVTCITGYQPGGSSCMYTVMLQDKTS